MNVLIEEKKQQVLALGRLGWSLRRIEAATGVRRETAGRYLRAEGVEVRQPGGWGRLNGAETAKAAIEAPTGARAEQTWPKPPPESVKLSACEPFREWTASELAKGRNAVGIWQDLVDVHGFAGRYDSVKRFARKLHGTASPEARAVIETAPGEEAQVDWGTGPHVLDPATGKYRKTRLFVMTLGYSRKSVRLLAWKSGAEVWARLHEEAFRRLGGAARVVVLDYVAGNIIELMCPSTLCGHQLWRVHRDWRRAYSRPHNAHRD